MTAQDGVGAPRKPEIIERDANVLAAVINRRERGARVGDLTKELDLEHRLLFHSLTRLRAQGALERRDGYRWWPTQKALDELG